MLLKYLFFIQTCLLKREYLMIFMVLIEYAVNAEDFLVLIAEGLNLLPMSFTEYSLLKRGKS